MFHLHDGIKVGVFGILFKLLLHLVTLVSLVVNKIRAQTAALAGVEVSPSGVKGLLVGHSYWWFGYFELIIFCLFCFMGVRGVLLLLLV